MFRFRFGNTNHGEFVGNLNIPNYRLNGYKFKYLAIISFTIVDQAIPDKPIQHASPYTMTGKIEYV